MPPEPDPVALRLQALRERRARRDRAAPLSSTLAETQERLRRLHRRLGDAGRAWGACCPEEFQDRSAPIAFHSGQLTVAVSDAAVRHRLDRWLRAGGLDDLKRASRAPLRRVTLRVSPADCPPPPPADAPTDTLQGTERNAP